MQKKIVAGLLSVMMLATTLTGCSGSGESSQPGEEAAQPEEVSTEETETPEQADQTAPEDASSIDATGTVYDLGGLTLPICDPGSVNLTYMGNDTWCAGVSYNDGTAVQ